MMARWIWMVPFCGLLACSGCEPQPVAAPPGKVTSEDVRRDAGKAAETAAEYSKQSQEEFQKSLKTRLAELDMQLEKLREKGRDLKDEAKVKWDQKMVELEAKRKVASEKLAEVGKSSAEAWKDIQQGAQAAWDELDKSFREAAREF